MSDALRVRTGVRRLSVVIWLVSVGAVVSPAVSPASGRAPGIPAWSSPVLADGHGLAPTTVKLKGVSCPSAHLCVAVDRKGEVLTTSRPTRVGPWHAVEVSSHGLYRISCPSIHLCVAAGAGQELFVSGRPAGQAHSWRTVRLAGVGRIGALTCAGTRFCVVLDSNGVAFDSTDPGAGARAWHRRLVEPGSDENDLSAVSCPTVHFCAATDSGSNSSVFTTTHPGRAAGVWRKRQLGGRYGLAGVACPSAHLCVATGYHGEVWTSTAPATGEWRGRRAFPDWAGTIACPSTRLCVAMKSSSYADPRPNAAFVFTDPAQGRWHSVPLPRGRTIGVGCPSERLCVAVTVDGFALSTSHVLHGPWRSFPMSGAISLTGVSCPDATFCVAVDDIGDTVTSTDPTGQAPAWRRHAVDPGQGGLVGVSCPTRSLCVAADAHGGVLTSTRPGAGPRAWHRIQVDPHALSGVDCPSTRLCLLTGGGGTLLASAHPTAGARDWKAALIDPDVGSPGGPDLLTTVTCASANLCLVGDAGGDVLSSNDPAGRASAWQEAALARPQTAISGASCPSLQFCAVIDTRVHTSTDPRGGASSWQPQFQPFDPPEGPTGVSCSSATFCVAFETTARYALTTHDELYVSTDPAGGQSAWRFDGRDPAGEVTSISCQPATTTCVAVDDRGHVLTSQ